MNSFEYSYEKSQQEWSPIASALPSVFNSVAISNEFTCDHDLVQASKLYSLPRVDVQPDTNMHYKGIPLGHYEHISLGAGASYTVYKRKFKQWDKVVAIKYIKSPATPGYNEDTSGGAQRLTVLREIHALCLFKDYPTIINLLAWGHSGVGENFSYLITDYAPLGSLDCFLRERKQGLKADCLFQICLDVADGIHAMHSQRWVHGDVKTANILMFEGNPRQGQFMAKLSDLGFSMSLDFDNEDTCYRGTDLYNAPEVRSGRSRRIKDLNPLACDVYSLGLLIWTVFKHGDFFLKGIDISVTDDSLDAQILDSVSAPQILGYALKFANDRASQDEARVLYQVFSACLQVDDKARLPVREIYRLLAWPIERM
ncbi:MAG: hypothetical protein OHK93_003355 [Ramalina farinacea]|uniref:Protein kinase domain-containing protein n=1 Tax=Ramalina farinacea TaxID=258253 RepID=A0AA43QWD7_9LECA|nr:hypothetical protein [Ramalina farinacea]